MSINYLSLFLLILPFNLWGQEQDSLGDLTRNLDVERLIISPSDSEYQKGKYDLVDYLYVLVDSTSELTFAECSSPYFQDTFIPLSEVSLKDLAVSQTSYWLRLSIESDLQEEVTWLTNFMEADVTAFSKTSNEQVLEKHCGFLIAVKDRFYNHQYGRVAALPIDLPTNNIQTYYWRINPQLVNGKKDQDLNLSFTLLRNDYLSSFLIVEVLIIALLIGFFLAVRNISLIYSFYRKSRLFLWYSLYCLASIFAGLIGFGYDLHYLVPEMAFTHYYFLRTSLFLVWVLVFILLSRSSLQSAKLTPRWDISVWIIFGMSAISFIAGNLVQWSNPILGFTLFRIGQILLIIIAIQLLIISIICMQKRLALAKYYLRALIILLIGVILSLLTYFQHLPAIYHVHWVLIAAWIHLRALAFGIGKKVPVWERQRHIALDQVEYFKELNALKTRLYTNISHELRTPLTVMLGMAGNIKGNGQERNLILRNGQKLLRLVNQLLDLSKFDSGTLKLNLYQSDIISYLNYLVESFYSTARERGINLTFYSEEEELFMDYDGEKLQQIVYNLLSNALKFTDRGGKIIMHAKLDNSTENAQLQLKFKDTGKGISKAHLPFIFDRFYQADVMPDSKAEGTGIGLALVKEYVELLGGQILVESIVGKGTVFFVRLPVSNNAQILAPENLTIQHAESTLILEEPLPKNRVIDMLKDKPVLLIVEDSKDVSAYIESIVEKDYQVKTAKNGKLGLEKAFQFIPDIIISDLMMPEMDGLSLTQILKSDERTSHIPIIILTAKAEAQDRISGLQTGADAYLTKPFHKEEMLIRLEKLTKLRMAMRQYYSNIDLLQLIEKKPSNSETSFLKKVGKIVEENLSNEDFTVAHFCRAVQLSQPQLYRKLTALTGKSPALFIRSFRLHKALELLKHSDLNISEIAWEVGFKDPSYFSRAFQKEFGNTPSELRK